MMLYELLRVIDSSVDIIIANRPFSAFHVFYQGANNDSVEEHYLYDQFESSDVVKIFTAPSGALVLVVDEESIWIDETNIEFYDIEKNNSTPEQDAAYEEYFTTYRTYYDM